MDLKAFKSILNHNGWVKTYNLDGKIRVDICDLDRWVLGNVEPAVVTPTRALPLPHEWLQHEIPDRLDDF